MTLGYIAKTFLAHEHALGYYSESLAIVDEEVKIGLLYNLGNVYKNMEEYDIALGYFNKSLALADQFNQSKSVSRAKVQLGIIFGRKAWYERSESQFRSIISETKTKSSIKYAGRAYHNLANNYMKQNDLISAINLFNNALELFTAETDQFITYMDM
ncbi:MAG: tetratricopeptide repeat protein [Bacteroidota bacterium]